MAKRKSLGQRSRFEVFKRDGFKCQYCGRNPPEAILQVDHIIAVANGGSSDDDRTFKYFCGICWGVIKTNRGEAAQ